MSTFVENARLANEKVFELGKRVDRVIDLIKETDPADAFDAERKGKAGSIDSALDEAAKFADKAMNTPDRWAFAEIRNYVLGLKDALFQARQLFRGFVNTQEVPAHKMASLAINELVAMRESMDVFVAKMQEAESTDFERRQLVHMDVQSARAARHFAAMRSVVDIALIRRALTHLLGSISEAHLPGKAVNFNRNETIKALQLEAQSVAELCQEVSARTSKLYSFWLPLNDTKLAAHQLPAVFGALLGNHSVSPAFMVDVAAQKIEELNKALEKRLQCGLASVGCQNDSDVYAVDWQSFAVDMEHFRRDFAMLAMDSAIPKLTDALNDIIVRIKFESKRDLAAEQQQVQVYRILHAATDAHQIARDVCKCTDQAPDCLGNALTEVRAFLQKTCKALSKLVTAKVGIESVQGVMGGEFSLTGLLEEMISTIEGAHKQAAELVG